MTTTHTPIPPALKPDKDRNYFGLVILVIIIGVIYFGVRNIGFDNIKTAFVNFVNEIDDYSSYEDSEELADNYLEANFPSSCELNGSVTSPADSQYLDFGANCSNNSSKSFNVRMEGNEVIGTNYHAITHKAVYQNMFDGAVLINMPHGYKLEEIYHDDVYIDLQSSATIQQFMKAAQTPIMTYTEAIPTGTEKPDQTIERIVNNLSFFNITGYEYTVIYTDDYETKEAEDIMSAYQENVYDGVTFKVIHDVITITYHEDGREIKREPTDISRYNNKKEGI